MRTTRVSGPTVRSCARSSAMAILMIGLTGLLGCGDSAAKQDSAPEEPDSEFTCWETFGYGGFVTNTMDDPVYFEVKWAPTYSPPELNAVLPIDQRTYRFRVMPGETFSFTQGLSEQEIDVLISRYGIVAGCNDSATWSDVSSDFGAGIDWDGETAIAGKVLP